MVKKRNQRIANWPSSTKVSVRVFYHLSLVRHLYLIKPTYSTSLTDNPLLHRLQLFGSSVSALYNPFTRDTPTESRSSYSSKAVIPYPQKHWFEDSQLLSVVSNA